MSSESKLAELRGQEYELRLVVDRLRREVYQQTDPAASPDLLDELDKAERELQAVEEQRIAVQADDPESGLILDSRQTGGRRGRETTGLEAKVHLRMAHVPTAIYHLFDRTRTPLISCDVYVSGESDAARRVRVSSFVEGYSARAVNTFEVEPNDSYVFDQLPTLFPDRIGNVNELTRATLNILVEDLDGAVELHETYPLWLLARTSAPLSVEDPKTGQWRDMTPYFGAFVTPNAPSLMKFLRAAAAHHPDGSLVGYQIGEEHVTPQVKALFEALKAEAGITYVNSVIDFNPDQGFASQRVRLPRESLADGQANCIDGTVLMASLLEGISINPAVVIVPGHAFLAWETWRNSDKWRFLETTMIGSHTFEEACASGEQTAARYRAQERLKMWSLRDLRTQQGITPME